MLEKRTICTKYKYIPSVLKPYIDSGNLPPFAPWWMDSLDEEQPCFLYQVFPGNTHQWQRLFYKAVRDGEFDVVKKMVLFFSTSHPDFITSREANSGNTVLHVGARFGHFDICKFLLENGCDVNARNAVGWTPLFFAAEGLHKRVAQLLIEWGCNVKIQNFRCQTAFDLMRHEDMKAQLMELGALWASTVPQAVRGRLDPIRRIIKDHLLGIREMADVSARCIQGSTLLHTSVHFEDLESIKNLLKVRVDVNLRDYQGASPLHRAKTIPTLELLLDCNADVNAADAEGNVALHVRTYGESGKESFLDGIKLLISRGADIIHRNNKGLMPVHCAAMQGRTDIIQLIVSGSDDLVKSEVDKEANDEPPSLPYLALAGNHLDCAKWLVGEGFLFKPEESNKILYKILSQQLVVDERDEAARFLLRNGALVNVRYAGADTAVHMATRMTGPPDVLQVLFEFGAKVDGVNEQGSTALFDAMQMNNFDAAHVLIRQGADVRWRNNRGFTALDLIHDYDEWIDCAIFSPDIVARLKAYKLKHARDLVRNISKKLKKDALRNRSILKQKGLLPIYPFLSLPTNVGSKIGSLERGTSPVPRFPSYPVPALTPRVHPRVTPIHLRSHTPRLPVVNISRKLALPPVNHPEMATCPSPQLTY